MKYIIEIEDEPFGRNDDPNIPHGMDELYRAKGFNALVFDKHGLDKLTPLDKALSSELGEAYHKGFEAGQNEAITLEYQRGIDDVWKAIMKIAKMPDGEREKIFGDCWISNILNKFSANEIINILDGYEPEQDEIKVGDEVESLNTGYTYIIHEADGGEVKGYNFKSRRTCCCDKNDLKKTGRHFPQIAELLKAMKESEVTE